MDKEEEREDDKEDTGDKNNKAERITLSEDEPKETENKENIGDKNNDLPEFHAGHFRTTEEIIEEKLDNWYESCLDKIVEKAKENGKK